MIGTYTYVYLMYIYIIKYYLIYIKSVASEKGAEGAIDPSHINQGGQNYTFFPQPH